MAEKQEVTTAEHLTAEGVTAPEESAVAMRRRRKASCPKCGRPLHAAPDGVDEEPVCLMHSMDPGKQSGPLCDTFWQEIERILKDAGKKVADFRGFVFPQLNFSGRKFQAVCLFRESTFTQGADFEGATFTQGANFSNATFMKDANFINTTFTKDAYFRGAIFTKNAAFGKATFTQDANFWGAIFTQDAYFSNATFTKNANFHRAIFTKDANFGNANFTKDANFSNAIFTKDANFGNANFTKDAEFSYAIFTKDAHFLRVIFTQDANFSNATFTKDANFRYAIFTLEASFYATKFHGGSDWQGSRFLDQATFRRTEFISEDAEKPGAVFALARFSKPGEIVFDDVDLSRVLFHNCDVSQFWFTSSARWGKREGNRGLAVFEETIDLKQGFGSELRRDGQRDYNAVRQIYQQLKKNYDSRLDYGTANEFHFSEMEMKRLAGPTREGFHPLRRWHRWLSFVALYRWASDYGNSYWKPLLWLLGTLLFFAALFPVPGLMRQGETKVESSIWRWDIQKGYGENLRVERGLALNSVIASVDAATFQRNPEYVPVHPWGRVLAIVETVLTSSLFALFLLAIRRQFRR